MLNIDSNVVDNETDRQSVEVIRRKAELRSKI